MAETQTAGAGPRRKRGLLVSGPMIRSHLLTSVVVALALADPAASAAS